MHYPVLSYSAVTNRLALGALCAAWGMAVALPLFMSEPVNMAAQSIGAATFGAGIAGAICAPFFGRRGWPGRVSGQRPLGRP